MAKWAIRAAADETAGIQHDPSHTRWMSGDVVFCSACGAHSELVVKKLAERCTGLKRGPTTVRNRLCRGEHPRTRAALPTAVPEHCWQIMPTPSFAAQPSTAEEANVAPRGSAAAAKRRHNVSVSSRVATVSRRHVPRQPSALPPELSGASATLRPTSACWLVQSQPTRNEPCPSHCSDDQSCADDDCEDSSASEADDWVPGWTCTACDATVHDGRLLFCTMCGVATEGFEGWCDAPVPRFCFSEDAYATDLTQNDEPENERRTTRPRFGAGPIHCFPEDAFNVDPEQSNEPTEEPPTTPTWQPASAGAAVAVTFREPLAPTSATSSYAAQEFETESDADADFWNALGDLPAPMQPAATPPALSDCETLFEAARCDTPAPSPPQPEVLHTSSDHDALRDLLELSQCGMSVTWPQGVDARIARLILDERKSAG